MASLTIIQVTGYSAFKPSVLTFPFKTRRFGGGAGKGPAPKAREKRPGDEVAKHGEPFI